MRKADAVIPSNHVRRPSPLNCFCPFPDAKELRHGRADGGSLRWIRRRGILGKGGWFTTKEMSGGDR